MKNIDKLTETQHKFLLAYVTETTLTAAVQKADIAFNTAYKMMEDEIFKQAYKEFRAHTLRQLSSNLEAHSIEAVVTLTDIMQDTSQTGSSRVAAARTILQINMKITEQEDILNRIEEIEKWMNN